ncbi:hypothetical protein M0813_21706 [Anaeramoeba flamelloides]|uniref:Uncharacterized protein n=1 Tax=Anaeramoeba flamelloides TaxID=1746091 RepID=A0ABQ8YH59_9EUKA|nr:hypothetical protein M0813_21706 [Anaeramoeba flamelloides]
MLSRILVIGALATVINFFCGGVFYVSIPKIKNLWEEIHQTNGATKKWEGVPESHIMLSYFLYGAFCIYAITFFWYWVRSMKPELRTKFGSFKIFLVTYIITMFPTIFNIFMQSNYPLILLYYDTIGQFFFRLVAILFLHFADWITDLVKMKFF